MHILGADPIPRGSPSFLFGQVGQNPFQCSESFSFLPLFQSRPWTLFAAEKTKQKKKRVNSRRDSKVEQDLHRTRTETPVTEKPVKKHRLTSVVSHRSTAGSTRSTGSPRHGPRDRRRPQKGGSQGSQRWSSTRAKRRNRAKPQLTFGARKGHGCLGSQRPFM